MLKVVALYNVRVVHAGVPTSVEYIRFEHFKGELELYVCLRESVCACLI